MDSPQSVVSPFKNLVISAEPETQKSDVFVRTSGGLSEGTYRKEAILHNPEHYIGVLDVYVHEARDIQNICIYHKQDVYAKLCLTSHPESDISTQIINGGGKNPVFNENIRLNVRTVESSLKCEIWMLSRVRNYLEDQLLGFALVPLSEVLIKNGKLEKEFSLSSTDLFHSPAGFVRLFLSYTGASPEVMAIPKLPVSINDVQELGGSGSVPIEFDNLEFPDPKIVNENQMMVSEYIGLSRTSLDSQTTESLVSSDTENHEIGVQSRESQPLPESESPLCSVSTSGSDSVSFPTSPSASDAQGVPSPNQENVSPLNDEKKEVRDDESHASNGPCTAPMVKPVITIGIEPEEKVVQQDIVDLYMKSMQQFTESLTKMKLPMDLETEPTVTKSGNSSSDRDSPALKNSNSRVFYGSRAFF